LTASLSAGELASEGSAGARSPELPANDKEYSTTDVESLIASTAAFFYASFCSFLSIS